MVRALSLSQPLRIGVIVGLDLVGDALIKLPFVRALRAAWPAAEIHWITVQGPTAYKHGLADVVKGLIDAVDEKPAWMPLAKNGRPTQSAPYFDLLIDTRGRWREALAVRRYVPAGLFISPALRYLLSARRPAPFTPRPRRLIDRLLQMVDLAAGYIPQVDGALSLDAALMRTARQALPEGPALIGFAPGAGNREKVWPLESFCALARRQSAKGRRPVFLLGPDEMDWQKQIMRSVPGAFSPLQAAVWGDAPLTISRTLAVGSLLALAVANDSGTGHMLAAAGCPLVSLFGPTEASKLAPKVLYGAVVRAQDFGGEEMERITVDAVEKAIESVLFEQTTK